MKLEHVLNRENHRRLVSLRAKTNKTYDELLNEAVERFYNDLITGYSMTDLEFKIQSALSNMIVCNGELTELGKELLLYLHNELHSNN